MPRCSPVLPLDSSQILYPVISPQVVGGLMPEFQILYQVLDILRKPQVHFAIRNIVRRGAYIICHGSTSKRS